jgi:hypothetical protein
MNDVFLKQSFNTSGRRTYKYDTTLFTDDYGDTIERQHMAPTDLAESTLITSEVLGTDKHKPCIDVDLPVRVYPSSTLGHFHLYIDKEMTWWQYRMLLRALVKAGVVEKGFYRASVARKATHLRLPWVRK